MISKTLIGMAAGLVSASVASAAVDSVQLVYRGTPTTALDGTNTNVVIGQLQGFGYNPNTDQLYVATSGAAQGLFRVDNVSGTSTSTRLESPTQYQSFTYDKQPLPFGMALNSVAFNGHAAYSVAYLVDGHTAGTTNDYTTARRVYSWNLQNETAIDGTSTTLTGGLNAQQILTAAGVASTTGNPLATIRRVAYGNDGRSLYFAVGGTTGNGIFRYDAVAGGVTKISPTSTTSVGTQEVGVQKISSTVDRVLYTDGASNIVYQDYDSSTGTVSAKATLLSSDAVRSFVGGATGTTFQPDSIVTDATGNIYFQIGTASQARNEVLRYDTQGRLAKMTTIAEIHSVLPTVGAVLGSTQVYAGTATGANGTFAVNQLYFGSNVTSDPLVGKINLYQPGDFNRDGVVNAADGEVLRASGALKTVGTTTTDTSAFKFDLNGDAPQPTSASPAYTAIVDYKDVKVLQGFLPFANGDTDFNLVLDLNDLKTVGANYLATAGDVWTQGDFNGDGAVNFADLSILADAWLNTLHQPNLTDEQLAQLGTGVYRSDVETAFGVPEPTSLAMLAIGAGLLGRRRRAGRA